MLWQGRRKAPMWKTGAVDGGGIAVGGGIGTMVIALIVYLLGGNPIQCINGGESTGRANPPTIGAGK